MAPSPSGRLNRIGNAYFGRGRYAEAFSCYQKALEYDRKAADAAELIATLGNLGNICAVSGQREQADTYYREVLSLQKRLGDEGGIGRSEERRVGKECRSRLSPYQYKTNSR